MYKIEWYEYDPLRVKVFNGIDFNVFVLPEKMTKEELDLQKKRRANLSPGEKLKEALHDGLLCNWRATELYPWFEKYCPGYKISWAGTNDVFILFADINHLVLFKLSWCQT